MAKKENIKTIFYAWTFVGDKIDYSIFTEEFISDTLAEAKENYCENKRQFNFKDPPQFYEIRVTKINKLKKGKQK